MAGPGSNGANATVSLSRKLNKLTAGGSLDYNSWRKLISEIETATPEDVDTISLAYDSFLSAFPLCHWHLEKYAYHKAKLCSTQEAVKIYERGMGTTMFSVGFWVDYFTFGTACFGDPEDVRRLFGRALSFIGKDYLSHVLWDKYMKYEFNQEGWSFLAQSYIQTLRFPTKKLQFYYNNFKQFVTNLEEEIGFEKDNSIEVEQETVPRAAMEISKEEISLVIKDLLDSPDRSIKSKALDRYRSLGEEFYQEARRMDEKIKCFETKIQRRYFNVTPLDDDQLNNWHLYLDFIEKQDNLDWAVKLYERCLIPCANYPEFWIRYVEFLESKGGRELAISAIDRASQIFLKNVPEIHLFNARFKEHIGDANGARAALRLCDTKTESSFIEKVATQANLERRLGNFAAASATYEKAVKTAREKQKLHVLPCLYSQFARLTFMITGNAAAARDTLIEGVQHVPHCRFLLEELIKFAMTHEGASQVNVIDSIIAAEISPGLHEYEGLNAKDRETISRLFLEFVDLCGTMHDIRKAWNRHVKLFPQFLRMKPTYKQSTSGNYSLDAPAVQDQPQGQKEVPEFTANHYISPEKDKLGPTAVHAELAGEPKENALSLLTSDQDLSSQSREGKPGQMDDAELAEQSRENVVGPHESDDDEVGKSSEAVESVSSGNVSLKSQEKESRDLMIPMSCDESTQRDISKIGFNSKAGPTVESPQVHNESERYGSVGRQHSKPTEIHVATTEPSSTGEDFIENDQTVHGDAQHNSAQRKRSKGQLGDFQEDKAADRDGPTISMSTEQPPASSQLVSYPQQNMNQIASPNGQQLWQTQQNLAMNQMLQYQQYQQELLQYQQQQQMQMQHPYYQMQHQYMSQQPYHLQPQQQNQQQVQLMHQQHYVQQQNQQMLGQQPHEKQYHQPQDYQSYQLAYQHAAQGQQLLLQQYQQYQGYQHLQNQQQSQEGSIHTQGQHTPQNPNVSQRQQGSKSATPDHNGAAEPSDSPHHRNQSPLQ